MIAWPMLSRLKLLRRDTQGNTLVEFALVAPVFLTMLMGMLDMGHQVYARSQLNGAVFAASRRSALETADTTAADALVRSSMESILPGMTMTSVRSSYYDFADIGRPERYTDTNGNNRCDNNEPYTDENRNGQFDNDVGSSGNGGASDVVVYTVTVQYEPIFKVPFVSSLWGNRTMTARAVRKNQPFALQQSRGNTSSRCP